MTLKETLLKAQSQAKTAIEQDAVFWLLLELLNISKSDYYLNEEIELETKFIKKYFKHIDDYLTNKIPVQYIIGESYFYNYKFYVNNHTLVPRVETEELVFRTIKYLKEYFKDKEEITILDLATGSGVIGITLKLELNNANVTISDISKKALRTAKRNINRYNLNIKTINSNWFDNINTKFDCIISNPPYIPIDQGVEDKVLSEPNNALFSGIEGLDSYNEILSNIDNYLNDKALVAFEHGYDQKDKLKEIINNNLVNVNIKQEKDLSDKDRYTFIFK